MQYEWHAVFGANPLGKVAQLLHISDESQFYFIKSRRFTSSYDGRQNADKIIRRSLRGCSQRVELKRLNIMSLASDNIFVLFKLATTILCFSAELAAF